MAIDSSFWHTPIFLDKKVEEAALKLPTKAKDFKTETIIATKESPPLLQFTVTNPNVGWPIAFYPNDIDMAKDAFSATSTNTTSSQANWFVLADPVLCTCGDIAYFKSPKLLCKHCWVNWFVSTIASQRELTDQATDELRARTKAVIYKL